MDYQQAEQLFTKARTIQGEKRKRLDNNTYLLKEGKQYCIRLHKTIVVRIYPDNTYVLNSGGWLTPTTKDRINKFSSASLYQKNRCWYFSSGELFFDGIIISEDGSVINPKTNNETKEVEKKKAQLSKMINEYIHGFWQAVKMDQVGYPSGGDCWYCNFQTEDGQSLGDMSGHSHLIDHMEEKYYVPSLLYNAFKESHSNPDFIYQYTIHSRSDWHVRTTLKRYFNQRFNQLLELI